MAQGECDGSKKYKYVSGALGLVVVLQLLFFTYLYVSKPCECICVGQQKADLRKGGYINVK